MITVAGIVGMAFLIVAIAFHAGGSGLWRSSRAVLVYSPLFLLVIATFVGPIFALTGSNKLDRWLGDMSYPIYLCHLPVFSAMIVIGLQPSPANSIVGLLTTVFVSAALLWLIDAPVFRKSQLPAQETIMPTLRPTE
jgi:peptidoglycan/LPS O-acetylase OafA/YrhL